MLRKTLLLFGCAMLTAGFLGQRPGEPSRARDRRAAFVVLGFNDLGMHCCNQDFSEFMILPPYNCLHAQVIERTWPLPRLVTEDVTVSYAFPGNTESASKTNFWTYVGTLLGVSPPPNIGLTGNGLAGNMQAGSRDWLAAGIPIVPQDDLGLFNPFQLADIKVWGASGSLLAETHAVTPVSWELRCDFCHHGAPDAPVSVLDAHDRLHGTTLYQPGNQTPVLCGSCHAQPELGLGGQAGVESLSLAMHKGHSPRMMDVVGAVPKGNVCYACHPGPITQCLRDVHARMQMTCKNCHAPGSAGPESEMLAVGDPGRRPWTDMPRCDDCHKHPNWSYEQPGTLFRNSIGHGGLYCEACHNSTHAIAPARDDADNVQSVELQNHAGTIRKCTVCHSVPPFGVFRHAPPSPALLTASPARVGTF